jgi:hypothetical protein
MKKLLLLIIASIFGIVVLLNFMVTGFCSAAYSSDKIFSPDGKYFAQVRDRRCGITTTEDTTGVSISNAKSLFSNYDVPIAEIINTQTGNRRGVLGMKGSGDSIKMSWEDNRTLKVANVYCEAILGQDTSWNDIKIVYDRKCSENK